MDIERMQPLTNGELREVRRQLALNPPETDTWPAEDVTAPGYQPSMAVLLLFWAGVLWIVAALVIATVEVVWDRARGW